LGNGDLDRDTDLALLLDSLENRALLTGASIAGALRNYLREYQGGYGATDCSQIFGGSRGDDDGEQSPLIVNDALSNDMFQVEIRDGVKINGVTGTAAEKAKYDLELLEAGTTFGLQFELLLSDQNDEKLRMLGELAVALCGLEEGKIAIGMKKRRGFGRCHVEQWQVWQFDMTNSQDRLAWLTFDRSWSKQVKSPKEGKTFDILQPTTVPCDQRRRLTIEASFGLDGSLLIRSGQAAAGRAPDVVHLKSKRNGQEKPVLSGSSLAGVLRHRAKRILNTLNLDTTLLDDMFGPDFSEDRSKRPKASRLIVQEAEIENAADMVQNRIAVDRFTGGALHGALFDEQPVWGTDDTKITIRLELRDPTSPEIGLLLLLLKDLWTSDLPIGGESSIGRGRLRGIEAKIVRQSPEKDIESWTITQSKKSLDVSDAPALEQFVTALLNDSARRDAA
jgi:CRISPR/Cas system CSM-associated protein Csm3 (group 7 of RAMP superfamily)